jgi:hypothetical protein
MSGWIEPPPPQPRRMGCVTKGCLILSCFIVFLLIAAAVGLYFGMRTHSALVHGASWLRKTQVLATEPSPVPQFETNEANIASAKSKWNDFEQASESGQPASVELTAADLNNLIASNRRARGKAFVTIEGNQLRLQLSVPLGEYLGRGGYYLNGNIVVQTNGPQSLNRPHLSSITVNGQALPADALEWKYKAESLQSYLQQYTSGYDTVEIRDGKVILNKTGS